MGALIIILSILILIESTHCLNVAQYVAKIQNQQKTKYQYE